LTNKHSFSAVWFVKIITYVKASTEPLRFDLLLTSKFFLFQSFFIDFESVYFLISDLLFGAAGIFPLKGFFCSCLLHDGLFFDMLSLNKGSSFL
jgi:hypothetical protein